MGAYVGNVWCLYFEFSGSLFGGSEMFNLIVNYIR
jgi:hypothetical protein